MDAVRVTAWAWEVELHGRGEMVENASMDAVRVMALAVLCHCDGIACIPHRMHLPPHASPTACTSQPINRHCLDMRAPPVKSYPRTHQRRYAVSVHDPSPLRMVGVRFSAVRVRVFSTHKVAVEVWVEGCRPSLPICVLHEVRMAVGRLGVMMGRPQFG